MTETVQAGLTGGVASVNGTPVSPVEAVKAAAALLAGSRSAVVAGLGTDIAGARASVALARAIGASIDHMDAGAVFANLDVMRRTGWIVTTPLQVRTRADTVLLVGDGLTEAWPEMANGSGWRPHPRWPVGRARLFTGCPAVPARPWRTPRRSSEPGQRGHLPTLAALRALTAGRAISLDEAAAAPLRTLAAALSEARFGVAIWSAAALDTLAIEMLCGLIDDLNRKTRFAGLPLAPPNGAEGVTQATAWATGFPVRTGFAGSEPLHDPWRFDAQRLIASGEADAAIWISAFSATPPPWDNAVPTIALVPRTPCSAHRPRSCSKSAAPAATTTQCCSTRRWAGSRSPPPPRLAPSPRVADTVAAITAALPPC